LLLVAVERAITKNTKGTKKGQQQLFTFSSTFVFFERFAFFVTEL